MAALLPGCFLAEVFSIAADGNAATSNTGLFQNKRDIGKPNRPGALRFEPRTGTYHVSGGGENMWFTNDAFHFAWKEVSGDFSVSATIDWPAQTGHAHRKACLLARQNLTPGSPYVDVALHGDGLASLQYREVQDGFTKEIQLSQKGPGRVGLVRQGDTFFVTVSSGAGDLVPSGAAVRL